MKKTLTFLSALMMIFAVSCTKGDNNPKNVNNQTNSASAKKNSDFKENEARYSEDGKPIITFGTLGGVPGLFNDDFKKPKNVEIEIVDYSKLVDESNYDLYTMDGYNNYWDEVYRKIDLEIISGNAPDILYTSADHMEKCINKGIMADLYPIMDEYDGLKREDFTDCALEGLTIDGELSAVMNSYRILTAFAKTKFIGKEYRDWTSADAMEFYASMANFNKDMSFCGDQSADALMNYMIKCSWRSCMDDSNNVCNFSGTFLDVLRFCKENPIIPDMDYNNINDPYSINQKENLKGINDTQLVFQLQINGFNSSLAGNTYIAMNEEDITFVGYPSENGNGTYIYPNSAIYGITSMCSNKEAAWDIICRLLNYNHELEKYESDDTLGISVLKKNIQEDYDRPEDYNNSINSHLYLDDNSTKYITQEYKDMLWDYIMSIPADPYNRESVENIVNEECQIFINGDQSAEQTADILNSRIGIYMSENE